MEIYICRISDFNDFSGLSLVTEDRKARIEKYRFDGDKRRCLAAGLLLRYLLKDKAEQVREDLHGKPVLSDGSIRFNLSHSGEYAVLAADKNEIGVDIEQIKTLRMSVAQRCYTDEELNWMNAQDDVTAAFYRLWTGKESVMKATGLGFSLDPKSFSLLPVDGAAHTVRSTDWYLNWYGLENYTLCTAAETGEKGRVIYLSREDLLM